ncbi:BTB/POZ domain-containing protein 2-like [Dendronephthya gigantea]|uniref:BTB/POZ domain-containing protein 2-like n=1 Tax=Dendronephthya gigantea TaxID=151771 RepID=UPI00106AC451|nr:BTB/POZ domain-containing protein 2-like [Dendronephthya gigantea]
MVSLYSRGNLILAQWLLVFLRWKEYSVCSQVIEKKSRAEKLYTKTTVFDRISYLYNNSIMSDMNLTYGEKGPGEIFFAHRCILAAVSPVFYEKCYAESSMNNISSIHLADMSGATFAGLLSFVYKDECPTDVDKAFEVLRLALQYKVFSFVDACQENLLPKITAEKGFELLELLIESQAEALVNASWQLIDRNPSDYFTSDHFLNINQATMDALLARETLCSDEMTIFQGVMRWVDNQCRLQDIQLTRENRRKILGDSIYKIRFLAMQQSEFIQKVGGELLTDLEVIAIVKFMNGIEVPDLAWNSTLLKRRGSCGYWFLSARFWLVIGTILICIIGSVVCFNNRVRPVPPYQERVRGNMEKNPYRYRNW